MVASLNHKTPVAGIPVKESEILREITNLRTQLESLDVLLTALTERLTPVTLQLSSPDNLSEDLPECHSQLGSSIQFNARQVLRMRNCVNNLLDSLAL